MFWIIYKITIIIFIGITMLGYASLGSKEGKKLIKKFISSGEVIITLIPVINTLFLLFCIVHAIKITNEER